VALWSSPLSSDLVLFCFLLSALPSLVVRPRLEHQHCIDYYLNKASRLGAFCSFYPKPEAIYTLLSRHLSSIPRLQQPELSKPVVLEEKVSLRVMKRKRGPTPCVRQFR
jgi:hypothetical protein